jgi:hypothetical protein
MLGDLTAPPLPDGTVDDYATCAETYATFQVYHRSADPQFVSEVLKLTPTGTQVVGHEYLHRQTSRTKRYEISGWFLRSKTFVQSFDSEKHLNWLLDQIAEKGLALSELQKAGWWMHISCFWDSQYGHGGPTFSPELLKRLAALGVEVWFDVYFDGAYRAMRDEAARHAWKGT